MGLDMFLYAETWVPGYPGENPTGVKAFTDILSAIEFDPLDVDDNHPGLHVSVRVGYWRKAHAIHAWLSGNDGEVFFNARNLYVSTQRLDLLKKICLDSIRLNDATEFKKSHQIFSGPLTIDTYFWESLHGTVSIIDRLIKIKNINTYSIYYNASR